MSRLERLNDWCGEILNKSVKYDDLITFCALTTLLLCCVTALVVGILGGLGYLK